MSLRVDATTPPPVVLAATAWVYDASEAAPEAEELVVKVMSVLMKYFRPPASMRPTEPVALALGWNDCPTGVRPECACRARLAACFAAFAALASALPSGCGLRFLSVDPLSVNVMSANAA